MIRIDMSEFMERHTVARLVGAPPGYIGYEEGGQLTEAVRRKSYSVVLLDEIEKAHPEVFNILLQIMEDGRLTDAKGRKVDFRNTILIMTSNVGAELIKRDSSLGFNIAGRREEVGSRARYEAMKDKVLGELKKAFRPEFLNRIDGVMVFHQLTKEQIRQIVDLELKRIHLQLAEQQLTLELDEEAKDFLADKGWDQQYGARPLRRAITNLIEDPLSEALLAGRFDPGGTVVAIDRRRRAQARPEAALRGGGGEGPGRGRGLGLAALASARRGTHPGAPPFVSWPALFPLQSEREF